MIVITLELWPGGDWRRSIILGRGEICNDGTGTRERGNYTVVLRKDDGRIVGLGAVQDFPRLALGPWQLLRRALVAAFSGLDDEGDPEP